MKANAILNADMATIMGWLRQGFDWWLGELSDMVPPWLRRNLVRRRAQLVWDGADTLTDAATGSALKAGTGRADVCVPARLCLMREMVLPTMARRDLEAMLALEAERIMPLQADQILLAAAPVKRGEGGNTIAVAAIPRDRVVALLERLRADAILPTALRVDASSGSIDFLGAARASGLLPTKPTAPLMWWAITGLLIVLNLATLVWRDVDHVERMRAIVNDRRPLATGASRAVERLQVRAAMVREAIKQRNQSNPLVPLAVVSQLLPTEAWIQRFAWDGRMLRLSGYKRGSADIVKVLRDSGRFEDVRNTSSEVQAEIPIGQPFDITARARQPS